MAALEDVPPLVSPAWLNERLRRPGFAVLDASWYLPSVGRSGLQEFCQERIPGSCFLDIDKVAEVKRELPHMLPSASAFAAAADAVGINNDSIVVLYDRKGIFSAPRAWWMFRAFGHERVAVLNGGYPAWLEAGFEIDKSEQGIEEASIASRAALNPQPTAKFKARLKPALVRSLQQMWNNVQEGSEVVIDARDAGRFWGTAPEPRPGLRSGHIPGSLNVPFNNLLEDGRYKDAAQLRQIFEDAGVHCDHPIVTSCGTGVTACVVALALQITKPDRSVAVYDGSWTEWGNQKDTPVERIED